MPIVLSREAHTLRDMDCEMEIEIGNPTHRVEGILG